MEDLAAYELLSSNGESALLPAGSEEKCRVGSPGRVVAGFTSGGNVKLRDDGWSGGANEMKDGTSLNLSPNSNIILTN